MIDKERLVENQLLLQNSNTEKTLRKKIFFGFASLSLLLSLLFIFEGYDASLEFGHQMELNQLKENSNHVVEHLKEHLYENVHQAAAPNPQKVQVKSVEQIIHFLTTDNTSLHIHTPSPVVALVTFNNQQYLSFNNMNVDTANAIIDETNKSIARQQTTDDKERSISHSQINVQDLELYWMIQPVDDNISLLTVQKFHSLSLASETVLLRLIISSLVVLWIGFWASYGLAIFISKHITKINSSLRHLATHDILTDAGNHNYLSQKLSLLQRQCKNHEEISLIFISVNNIHLFDQIYGNTIKWRILRQFTSRLKKLSDKDIFIGRFDSNIFYMLGIDHKNQWSVSTSHRITREFHEPIHLDSVIFLPSLSIGIARQPAADISENKLISQASNAVMFAKDNRLLISEYRPEYQTLSDQKIGRSAELVRALKQREFVLFYQPKIDLNSGEVLGVEALVRWDHPLEGRLTPGDFIDLIETSSISRLFTEYIIKQSISQLSEWAKKGIHIPISVNISPYDLQDDDLVTFLRQEIEKETLRPEQLELELTESASTVTVHRTASVFKQLEELGIKRSIDDFGTGMSSLSYLKEIPFNTVKIDRAFIYNLLDDPISEAIVESILHIAKKTGWTVVAEGIESIDIANKLRGMECDMAQGFYFARPMPATEIEDFISNSVNYCI